MYECQQEANRITSKISPEDFAISKKRILYEPMPTIINLGVKR